MNTAIKRGIAGIVIALSASATASAQTFPAKPVRIIIGLAGGAIDVSARMLANEMGKQLSTYP